MLLGVSRIHLERLPSEYSIHSKIDTVDDGKIHTINI